MVTKWFITNKLIKTASSPFLDNRKGARNNRAKAENWSKRLEGAWGEAWGVSSRVFLLAPVSTLSLLNKITSTFLYVSVLIV